MSSLTVVTPPTADPVSLAEAKVHCRVDVTDDDGLIAGYLIAARMACEDETGRRFMSQTLDLKLDGGWPLVWDRFCARNVPRIVLPTPPLQSVTSIKYFDTNGTEQTLAADQYRVSAGDVFGFIEPAYNVSWPDVRKQIETITVRFISGYGSNLGDVPEPIRLAILLLTGHYYDNREAMSSANMVEMPLGVRALLQKYKTDGWV
jgi:uncharacterized phiE125 gp8 family phage protein